MYRDCILFRAYIAHSQRNAAAHQCASGLSLAYLYDPWASLAIRVTELSSTTKLDDPRINPGDGGKVVLRMIGDAITFSLSRLLRPLLPEYERHHQSAGWATR